MTPDGPSEERTGQDAPMIGSGGPAGVSVHVRKAATGPQKIEGILSPRISGVLRRDQVEAGARRLSILALCVAGAFAINSLFGYLVFPLPPGSPGRTLWLLAVAGGLGVSLGMAAVAGRRMLPPDTLLDAGLVFEVLLALAVGLSFHSLAFSSGLPERGSSPVAPWVLAYPLIVPNTRSKTLVATLAAALMDPLALAIDVAAGLPRPEGLVALSNLLPTALAAAIAIVVSRYVYELEVQAAHGREVGSYRLEELLGSGGMGEVWRASHRLLARPAAIKLIRYDPIFDWSLLVKRFEREARATAALRSPHTVDVYDYGTTEDGNFYYVMELLNGYDLHTLVERFGPLPPERAAFLLAQACHSLAEAHERSLIHRDVKPANIYVCRYGIDSDFVKLLDFGMVKDPIADAAGTVTATRVIAGTPGYMSPEMALGSSDVDWRSDIYALGCVAYWLLTAHPVFEGSATQILRAHIETAPPPPASRGANALPPELERLVLSCLEKDRERRPQSARELRRALEAIPFASPWSEERARAWWLQHGPRAG